MNITYGGSNNTAVKESNYCQRIKKCKQHHHHGRLFWSAPVATLYITVQVDSFV